MFKAFRFGLAACLGAVALAQGTLVLGRDVALEVDARGVVFLLAVPPATTARLVADQIRGDFALSVTAPGRPPRLLDAFDFGPESVTIASDAGARFVVCLSSVGARARVRLRLVSLQPTAAGDELEARAEDAATSSKRASSRSGVNHGARLQLAEESLRLWTIVGNPLAETRTVLRLGDIHFASGAWRSAGAAYADAKKRCASVGSERCLAEATNNLGLTELNLGEIDSAFTLLREAADSWRRSGEPDGEVSTRLNLGLAHWHANEWQLALKEYEVARRLAMTLNRRATLARVINNVGLVYLSMAEFEKAAILFAQALATAPADAPRRDLARFRLNLGRAHMLAGQPRVALTHQQLALATFDHTPDEAGKADVQINLGQIYLRLGAFGKAETALGSAIGIYDRLGMRRGRASALHTSGLLAAETGDPKKARALLAEALQIRRDLRISDEVSDSLYQLARLERRNGLVREACDRVEESIRLIENLRERVEGERLRAAYLSAKQKHYDFLIESLMGSSADTDASRAFSLTEQARSRSLMDSQRPRRSLGGALANQQGEIRRKLNYLSSRLANLPRESDQAAPLRRQVDELVTEDMRLASLRSSSLMPTNPVGFAGITQIQQLLAPGDLMLKYYLGETSSFLWIVSATRSRVRKLQPSGELERRAEAVHQSFGQASARKQDSRRAASFAAQLLALAHALGLRAELTPETRRVALVPDGALHHVPFAALPAGPYGRPLGVEYELVQAPSASAFQLLRARRLEQKERIPSITAFVDPVFDALDARVIPRSRVGAMETPNGHALRRLVHSRFEVDLAEKILPAPRLQIRQGFDANKSSFLNASTWNSAVTLVSTHAIADGLQPELSTIFLSRVTSDGQAQDGMVRLYEMDDVRIPGSLVILSACDAANGRSQGGEGLISFARSFMNAGASGLMAPLNKVDEESTSSLVASFLQGIVRPRGLSPARSLQRARGDLALSRRWRDPYYWGAFVLFCSWD